MRVQKYQKVFFSLDRVLTAAASLKETRTYLMKLMVEVVQPADRGIVYLCEGRYRQLVAKASYNYHCDNIEHKLGLNEGAPGQCYALRKSLLFSSIESISEQVATLRPENLTCYTEMIQGLPPTLSMAVIPIKVGERVLGVVLLESCKQHRIFSEEEIPELEALSAWLGLISDNMYAQLELKQIKHSYKELLSNHITSVEDERREIARKIHDEMNMLLILINLQLEKVENTLQVIDSVEVRNELDASRLRIKQALDSFREMSFNLRPPSLDNLGIIQALDWYIHSSLKEVCFPITMEVGGRVWTKQSMKVDIELFRIAQEALSNVIKHAQATSARVELSFSKSRLVLVVEDNGVGFDPYTFLCASSDKRNLGLLGMKERAKLCGATLEIVSAHEQRGTRVKVIVPISSYV